MATGAVTDDLTARLDDLDSQILHRRIEQREAAPQRAAQLQAEIDRRLDYRSGLIRGDG